MRSVTRLGLALFLALLVASPAWAANAFVQVIGCFSGSGTTCTYTTNGTTQPHFTAGNLIALDVEILGDSGGAITVASVTSDCATFQTPTGTAYGSQSNNSVTLRYAENIAPSGACSITVTLNGSGIQLWYAHEISGALTSGAQDQANVGTASTGTSVSSGSVTTTTDGQYIYAGGVLGSGTFTVGSGFTDCCGMNGQGHGTEYQIQGTQGSIAGTATASGNTDWVFGVMTFKAAAGASSTPRHRKPLL